MMPGETHPAAPGTAADLARCQGCASLQQNLNEYVEALITLKQKIINTDNLLTEYQKKCDELQFARRENSTLHHQVEQMLQKISPLQKCQEELGSLKAELEEKKSSLKLYQDTHQEYARVKEECLKSDAQKKKLEAKVKKLEEAAVKQTQDFKQLRNEKKILEKEFKKTQERLDEFSKQKNEKELRHIGTQISSDSYGSIDKRKVKLLLKELWLCVNSAHRLPVEGSRRSPEKLAKENAFCGASGEDGALPLAQSSPPRTSGVQACLTELSMEIEGDFASCESAEEERPSGGKRPEHASHEESCSMVSESHPDDGADADFAGCGHSVDEDLEAAISFFKLPPPLLSPVPSPPLAPSRLGSCPSLLAPETYFGEYTDSSDNDSAPLRNSAESASEEDATESQDYFGLLGKSKGSDDKAVQTRSRFAVNKVTPVKLTQPLATAPREPSATLSLARGGHWAASPEFVSERERDILDAADRQVEVREPGKAVQAKNTLHRPTRHLWMELSSGGRAQDKEVGAQELEVSSAFDQRTLNEFTGSEGKPPASKTKGSPRSGFFKYSLTDGIAAESDHIAGASHFQRSRARAKERDAQRSTLEPPKPEDHDSDDAMEAVGLGGEGSFSSSTSVSVCNNPWSLRNTAMEAIPREPCHTEQLQTRTSGTFLLQSEPHEPSAQKRSQGNGMRAGSSGLRAAGFNDQQSRKIESTGILKGTTKMYSLPQPVFQKETKGGPHESRGPTTELPLRKSDLTTLTTQEGLRESWGPATELPLRKSGLTILTCSQAGSITSGSGPDFIKSTSWHQSDILRRGGHQSPRGISEREQKGSHQPEKAASALEDGGLAAMLELPRENTCHSLAFKATAASLPNQVSVITKQTRHEKTPRTSLGQQRPQGDVLASATESPGNKTDSLPSVAKHAGSRDGLAQSTQEITSVKSCPLEVSTPQRKPDLGSPSGSFLAENLDCSTDSKFSFSSEDSLSQSQDSESEPALQGERQTPPQSPHIMISGAKRLEGEGLPLAEITEPCEDKDQPSTEAPVTSDAPSTPQHVGALRKSHIAGTPVCSSTLGNTDEETQHIHQSSLPTVSCCYTGIREQGGEDTEVEESEAFSCSEGEHEAEVTTQGRQQHVLGDLERCVAEARPFADVSYLTSALQDFNISTFPDLDRLSTSEVVMFLESCQLRDCSSGDSMSECSSKGTLSKELKQNTLLGGKRGKQICEELLGISEEWIESDEYSKNPSQRAPCSLETLSEVLTKLGQELHAHHEDCSSKGDNLFLLSAPSSQATEGVEAAPLKETPNPPTCAAELPLPADPSPTLHAAELPLPADSSPTPHTTELPLPADPSPTPHTAELPLPADPSPITHTAQLPLPADSSPITHTTELPLPADPRPITHTTELPLPADRNIMGCSPSSEGSCQEHILSRPGEESSVTRWANIGEGDLSEPEVPSVLSFDSEAQPRTEQSSSCEAETTFQYRISTVTSEVINVLINKDQNVVVENGNSWTIISRVAFSPGMEQVILCDTLEDDPVSQDQGVLETGSDSVTSEMLPEASHTGPPLPEPPCGRNAPGSQEDVSSSGQSANFDKSRLRSRPVKPSIWVSSRTYGQTLEAETVASDHTYCNWRLDPVGKSKTRSKILNKDQSPKPGKAPGLSRDDARQGEVAQPSGERGSTKTRSQAQPIVANADTSTPTDCSDTLSMIRQEVGPPLPPLLAPLIATPPRTSQPLSPLISSSSPSSPPSPTGHTSPLCEIPGPEPQQASPPGPSPSPSPSTAAAGERIMSSPLQFCAATPKHALPVPGRLPPCAPGPAAMGGPQENSVKILDTMYPELSARARTLSLLKGNLQLSVDGKMLPGRVSALLGFKALTSTSTAFVKTGSGSGADGSPERSGALGTRHGASGKRTLSASILRSAKRLRLDSESPEPENKGTGAGVHGSLPEKVSSAEAAMAEEQSTDHEDSPAPCLPGNPKETVESHDEAIASALKKIGEASFDLLPVIRSHVYVGNISKKPVMRDQEKEVVYEFSTAKKHLAECLLRSILSELKLQKTSVDHSYLHALCRVYVGVCRQLGDLARARLFCYSVLKEDFPESEKLTLFIANTWHDVFLSQSVISKAMQLVARHRAKGEVQNCLRAFLHWEKNAPVDVGIMVSKLLLTIQLCPKTEFQSSEKFGEDLSDSTWEYVFAIDLLCCHQKWVWTHDHVISKELWPVMDKWIKYRKGHANIAYTPDVIVASILRLIGRLGQLGLKEGFPTAVKNISSVIGMFIQHARDEEIPWGIQLAAVYALCDLSPSNPTEISKILEAWRRETSNIIPSAVVSCLEEVGSLSAEGSDP